MKYKNLNNVVLIKAPCNKVILTDVDGVLLDWEWAFNVWMQEHGFEEVPGSKLNYDMSVRYGIPKEQVTKLIRIFNESAAIGFLPALRDAMYYVKRLHEEHGYVFHCITSLSLDPNAGKLREMNLHKLFGKQAFERIVCLDTGADKVDALMEYQDTGCYWIEDKPENAVVGHRAGLRSLLVEHGHNMHFYHGGVTVVKNWKEIYQLITSQE
jgi:beta-phosphoglucomutase-like phosphatase (HAD superfamily)